MAPGIGELGEAALLLPVAPADPTAILILHNRPWGSRQGPFDLPDLLPWPDIPIHRFLLVNFFIVNIFQARTSKPPIQVFR